MLIQGLPAGLVHVSYSTATRKAGEREAAPFARHGSLMTMISGGFGLKKFFEDSEKEKDKVATATAPHPPTPKPAEPQVMCTANLTNHLSMNILTSLRWLISAVRCSV